MRRLFFAVAMLALLIPAGRPAEARTDISIDFFYDNLADGGAWVDVADYGYCWQPTVAVSNRSWRPYADGYWAYTDVGWTWVSYEDFGWATYHYGRWIRLRGRGWVWVPGREWGPAWVSWRTGGDYVGWAPLPPRRAGDIYVEFSPITAQVDIDFDIGPAYYNFIEARYIGEPVLRERIFAPEQNVTYITKTVNVTNITYTNSTVYNYGPDYNTLSRYSTRPIQRLSLQRETNVDPAVAAQSKSLMKVQGDKLVIAAPQQFQKPTKTIAPKVVKEKIAQNNVERGWEPVSDPKAQAELKEKMKKEDPKSIPPPTTQPSEKTEATASPAGPTTTTTPVTTSSPATAPSASPMTSAPPAPTTSASPSAPKEKDKKDKNKRPDTVAPNASASVSPGTTSATTPDKKNKRNEKVAPSVAPSASVPPATTPVPPSREKAKDKQREKIAPSASVPPSSTTETTAPTAPPKPPKEKPDKRKNERPSAAPPAPMESAPRTTPPPMTKPESVEKPKQEAPPPDSAPKTKKEPPQERVVPPAPPANPPGRDDGKKQKKNEPSTSPTP
jgi:hypothetical protein